MFNIFSKNQQIVISIAISGTSVSVNGTVERRGTAHDCMQYIRSMLNNYDYWMDKDKTIGFTLDSKDNTPVISAEKFELTNQLKRLSSSFKCQVKINSGINFMV